MTYNVEAWNLQFKDENHFVFILVCIMQVNQLVMVKMVHYINLFPDQSFFHGMRNRNKLGSKHVSGFDLSASMDDSKSSGSNFFQDVVIIVYTLLCFDIHRLRNVFCVNIEDKLIIIFDFAFLTSNFLSSVRVDCKIKMLLSYTLLITAYIIKRSSVENY